MKPTLAGLYAKEKEKKEHMQMGASERGERRKGEGGRRGGREGKRGNQNK